MSGNYKILAYCALHYGAEYLHEAIQAIYPFVDKIIFLYSEKPSYGKGTHLVCPDGEEQLKAIAMKYPKCEWIKVNPCHEGNHRGNIFNYTDGYDGVLVFDADEVYEQADLPGMIDYCMQSDNHRFGIDGYINFYRSFNEVCYDFFRPIRFFNMHNKIGQDEVKCRIYHFGCAQRLDIMRYKLEIHGHHAEIRHNWLDEVYLGTGKTNLHLVANGIWNVQPFDKEQLPEMLKNHPNFNRETIL